MIVGIDLGTTHSLIGAYRENGPELFKNPHGELLTPSVISINEDHTILVGAAAQERLITHPRQSIANFKRWMGSNRETLLGHKGFRPEELSALVLRSLIADAEAATGKKVTEAVISVPAYFSDAQRKATKLAGELAGVHVERLINEPTAAALAYGLQERAEGGNFLMLDLGGGTFDVSILEIFDGIVEVHASTGDNFLGGEDFLQVLLTACCKDLNIEFHKLSAREQSMLLHKLERLKRELTKNGQPTLNITLASKPYQWQTNEESFSKLSEALIQRMRGPIERAVRDARLKPHELDEIVLVGGASRMSLVSRLISKMFGRLPLRNINPDHTIAMGAVIASGLKVKDERLEEVILTDVCPYTLGIDIAKQNNNAEYIAGFFMPIIPRNSTVPISRSEDVYPIFDDQQFVHIEIFQGESPTIDKNIKLGEFNVTVPSDIKSDRGVSVRFTYDINGILQVEATVKATGITKELILQQNSNAMTEKEIRARLAALNSLKIHPRDKQENTLLLARAARIYEEYLDYRDAIQNWIVNFQQTLSTQNEALIEEARNHFNNALNELENNIYQ